MSEPLYCTTPSKRIDEYKGYIIRSCSAQTIDALKRKGARIIKEAFFVEGYPYPIFRNKNEACQLIDSLPQPPCFFNNVMVYTRTDLISVGGTYSTTGNVVQIIAGQASLQIKVYAAGYEILSAGLHYFFFSKDGTAPSIPTTNVFLAASAVGRTRQLYMNPVTGPIGQGLYLYAAVNETNMPIDVQITQE